MIINIINKMMRNKTKEMMKIMFIMGNIVITVLMIIMITMVLIIQFIIILIHYNDYNYDKDSDKYVNDDNNEYNVFFLNDFCSILLLLKMTLIKNTLIVIMKIKIY